MVAARNSFFENCTNNLQFLLETKYLWMNDYVSPDKRVVEVGAGAGLSKEFIRNSDIQLTDYLEQEWIDVVADGLAFPFSNESVDVFISSNTIHHLPPTA